METDFRSAAVLCRHLAELFDRLAANDDHEEALRLMEQAALTVHQLDDYLPGPVDRAIDGR